MLKKEEILFYEPSESWGHPMPVTLLYWHTGDIDLHCQTGDHHTWAIEKAKRILERRNLVVEAPAFLGPTGMYYPVKNGAPKNGTPPDRKLSDINRTF